MAANVAAVPPIAHAPARTTSGLFQTNSSKRYDPYP